MEEFGVSHCFRDVEKAIWGERTIVHSSIPTGTRIAIRGGLFLFRAWMRLNRLKERDENRGEYLDVLSIALRMEAKQRCKRRMKVGE